MACLCLFPWVCPVVSAAVAADAEQAADAVPPAAGAVVVAAPPAAVGAEAAADVPPAAGAVVVVAAPPAVGAEAAAGAPSEAGAVVVAAPPAVDAGAAAGALAAHLQADRWPAGDLAARWAEVYWSGRLLVRG